MSHTQAYLHWLEQQHRYSGNTLKAVQRDLQWLSTAVTAGDQLAPVWSSLTADDVRTALSRARAQGLAAASLARLASSCRGFVRYLQAQGVVSIDLMQGVRTPRKPKRLPKALSPDEAAQLLQLGSAGLNAKSGEAASSSHAKVCADASNAPPPVDATNAGVDVVTDSAVDAATDTATDADGLRQALVLAELLYGSGLRISEALGLDRSEHAWRLRSKGVRLMGGWLDESAGELHIMGKGAKPRVVPLTSLARDALLDFIAQPVAWPADATERPVFVSRRAHRLSVRSAQRLLADLARQSGLDRHVHPHMLRHSFASHVLQSSGDLRAVQELMGHASIASTQVYTSLDFQHLSAVYDKAHPRARSKQS